MNAVANLTEKCPLAGLKKFIFRVGLLLLLFHSKPSGNLCAQDMNSVKISLHFDKIPLRSAFLQIEKASSFTISFPGDGFDIGRIVSLSADDITVSAALEKLLQGTHCTLLQKFKTIVIREESSRVQGTVITGRVTESVHGGPLAGVTVSVKGGKGAVTTNENGIFSITAQAGDIILIFSYTGYQRQEWRSNKSASVNISLRREDKQLNEVMVSARRRLNTEASVLNERKNSAVVQDAISAMQIEKTASINTTQALQRVAGVTVTDDRYVAIRGLGDRSVIAELNGARLSSANPDRSAVPLDLIPAGLLDNITVYKTQTPDRPADASAGIIELKTKSVPDSMILSASAQVGTNTEIGLGGNYTSFRNSNLGFLGQEVNKKNLSNDFLNLSKQYPGGVTEIQQLVANSRNSPAQGQEAYRINGIMHSLDPVLTTSSRRSVPNQIYGISFGNTFNIFNGHKLGLIISANYYRRTENIYRSDLTQWGIYQGVLTGTDFIFNSLHIPNFITPNNVVLGKYLSYKQDKGTEELNYGGLLGLTYQFNKRNELSVQYVGSRGAEQSGTYLNGQYSNSGLDNPVYNYLYGLRQMYRTFNTLNVQGEHQLWSSPAAPRISWNASRSKSSQNEPDFRFVNLAEEVSPVQLPNLQGLPAPGTNYYTYYAFVRGIAHIQGLNGISGLLGADPNGRRFRKLSEDNQNYKLSVTFPFQAAHKKQAIKIGGYYLRRDRTFTENILGIPGSGSSSQTQLLSSQDISNTLTKVNGNPNLLVSADKIGLGDPSSYDQEAGVRTSKYLYEIKKSPNNYTGFYEVNAFYAMADLHLTDRLRAAGGVRFETTEISATVDTVNVFVDPNLVKYVNNNSVSLVTIDPKSGLKNGYAPFYSANLIYTLHENMNFRLAYSSTVARPELREMTNIFEFDPFQFAVYAGNPHLINQHTESADFRWEWFPRSGEVIAASFFAKRIHDQLTKTFTYSSQGDQSSVPEYPVIQYVNDPEVGKLYGIELEIRKNLGILSGPLKHLFLGTNIMLANSVITKNPARLAAARTVNRNSSDKSPLFEQPPYSINTYLDYDNPRIGTSLTANFNIVGERLIQVQLDGSPDIYSRPVPMLDFVWTQQIGRKFVLKAFAKNVLNPPYREVYSDPARNGKYFGRTYIREQHYKGTELAVGLTYKIL